MLSGEYWRGIGSRCKADLAVGDYVVLDRRVEGDRVTERILTFSDILIERTVQNVIREDANNGQRI